MKKIITLFVFLVSLFSFGDVLATEVQYDYLTRSAFELGETGAPPTGVFASNYYSYGGWRRIAADVNVVATSPIGTGRALELVATNTAAPRMQYQNVGLYDAKDGATYLNLRVFETDFYVTGSTVPTVQLFGQLLYLKNNGDNNLYLKTDTRPSGTKFVKKIDLDVKHHVKMVYQVSSNQTAPGDSVVLAIYVDGVKIINDISGNTLIPAGGLPVAIGNNYFKDTLTNVNNGLAYSAASGFNMWILNNTGIPAGQTTKLYVDNVRYYGVVIPTVASSYPAISPKDTLVPIDATLTVTFNNAVDATTLNSSSIILTKKSNGNIHSCIGSYNATNKTYSIDLSQTPLLGKTDYVLTVKDTVNEVVAYAVEFTTAESKYNYLRQSAFESTEVGAPPTGAFAGNYYSYGGWRRITADVNVVATSPIGTGRALELVATNTATPRMQYQNVGYFDAKDGAVYLNTRVFETDFYVTGSTVPTVQLFGQLLYLKNNGDNNLYLKTDTRPSGTKFVKKIDLDVKHHVKMVYQVSSNQTAPGDSVVLAIYVDGVKIINDISGNTLIPAGGLPVAIGNNYFKDTLTNVNNGLAYSAASGFNMWILNNTGIPSGQTTKLYVDNVRYYGVVIPAVTSSYPAISPKNTFVPSDTTLSVTFNNAMDVATMNASSITLTKKNDGATHSCVGSYDVATKTYSINLLQTPLLDLTDYVLTVKDTVMDTEGNEVASYAIEFTSAHTNMNIVKQRVIDGLMLPTASPTTILSYWQVDGSFSNINYSDTSLANWDPINHLINVAQLCKIINTPTNSNYNNSSIRSKIVSSLDYWANGNFISDNWWFNDVAAPASLSEILLFEKNSISTATYTTLKTLMQKGSIFSEQKPTAAVERVTLSTGGNLTDKIIATIKMTVATENDADMVALMSLMENELRFFPPTASNVFERDSEGIKGDYSFHQHYNMLYFGGYGQIFIQDTNQILQYVEGTKYMLSDRALNVYGSFMLQGIGMIYRGSSNDYTVVGRGISRPSGVASSNILSCLQNGIDILLRQPGVNNKTDLQNLKDNKINTDNLYGGNKYFWQSDYMVHKRANYHYGVKTTSDRMRATETANGENLYGYYLGDGAVNILKTGNEYTDIFPVWDWNKVPGTTTAQGYLPNLSTLTDWMMVGNTSFVGGVSDGKYGMNVLDYSRDGVVAKKAWFMFDDEIVSLGSGISSNTNREIYTSINQCNLIGSVIAKQNGNETTLNNGTYTLTNTNWVLNNGIGYIFNNNTVALQNISKTGQWSTINTSQSTANVTKNVFSLGLSHGTNPSNASYQYITLMNTDATALNTYVTNPAVSVLSNTSSLQAVWNQNTNMAQIAFWQAGNITFPNGIIVTVDMPCLLMYQQLGSNYKLVLSNPLNTSINVHIVLSGTITDNLYLQTSSGQNGGASVSTIR